MKKTIKNFLLIVLTTLLLCSSVLVLFSLSSKPVKAESSLTDSNGVFSFLNGTSAGWQDDGTVSGNYGIRSRITLNDMTFDNLSERDNVFYATDIWGASHLRGDTYYNNVFTVNRVNLNGTETPLYNFVINYTLKEFQGEVVYQRMVWTKKLAYCDEMFDTSILDVPNYVVLGYAYDVIHDYDNLNKGYKADGYQFVRSDIVTHEGWLFYDFSDETQAPFIDISTWNVSPFTKYNVTYSYKFSEYYGNGIIFGEYRYVTGKLTSKTDSIFDVLTRAVDADRFDTLPEETKPAFQAVLDDGNTQDVKIAYLVPIEGTPFATKVVKDVKIPVFRGAIALDDVYAYLNVKTLDVYDAHVERFNYSLDDGIYVAEYYKSFWLRATTTEGHHVNYFNDFNQSYYEYFYKHVESGVFNYEAYEFMFNSLLTKYPALLDYQMTPENVYGLWGMAVLPESYSIDSIWKDLFSTETTKGEHVSMFSFKRQLTSEEFNSLLDTYEYNWLEKIWNNVGGFVEGKYSLNYVFYAEPGTEISWLDLTGQTEEKEDVKEDSDNSGIVVPGIGGAIEDVGGAIGGVIGGVKDGFASAKNFIYIALIGAIGITALIVILKYRNKNK